MLFWKFGGDKIWSTKVGIKMTEISLNIFIHVHKQIIMLLKKEYH